jgi:hypothetical protein
MRETFPALSPSIGVRRSGRLSPACPPTGLRPVPPVRAFEEGLANFVCALDPVALNSDGGHAVAPAMLGARQPIMGCTKRLCEC